MSTHKKIQAVISSLVILCCATSSNATLATFDGLSEGFQGVTFSDGGITFFDRRELSTSSSSSPFAIEDASGNPFFGSAGASFSPPNVLSAGSSFSPGPMGGFGFGHAFKMMPPSLSNGLTFDGFFVRDPVVNNAATDLVVNFLKMGALVDSKTIDLTSFTTPTSIQVTYSVPAFDQVHVFGSGGFGGNVDRFGGAFDNIKFTAVPEPSYGFVMLGGLGLLCACNRRSCFVRLQGDS